MIVIKLADLIVVESYMIIISLVIALLVVIKLTVSLARAKVVNWPETTKSLEADSAESAEVAKVV